MASKKRAKRPTSEYLDRARELSRFVPSLRKYKRRKTLGPHEKAVISRFENEINKVNSGTSGLIPLTAQQVRALDDPKQHLVGHGVRAVRAHNFGTNEHPVEAHVKNGRLVLKGTGPQKGRDWTIVPVHNPDDLLPTALGLLEAFGEGNVQINMVTTMGRAGDGIRSFLQAENVLAGISDKYSNALAFVVGLAYMPV